MLFLSVIICISIMTKFLIDFTDVWISSSPQVCLEGEISRQSILNSLSRGKKASGDLIPWTVSEQVHTGHKASEKTITALVSTMQS